MLKYVIRIIEIMKLIVDVIINLIDLFLNYLIKNIVYFMFDLFINYLVFRVIMVILVIKKMEFLILVRVIYFYRIVL